MVEREVRIQAPPTLRVQLLLEWTQRRGIEAGAGGAVAYPGIAVFEMPARIGGVFWRSTTSDSRGELRAISLSGTSRAVGRA